MAQFEADAAKLHFRAEEEQNWILVSEANSLKKTAYEKRKIVSNLVDVAHKLEDEIKTV